MEETASQALPATRETSSEDNRMSRATRLILCGIALVAVITLFAAIRWRVREMPLERDEGEYAYAGQLILRGVPPYQIVYNMKLPGTYVAYALLMRVFGENPEGIHIGLLLVNACTSLLMFLLARRLYGDVAGVAAAASYGLLSTSEAVLGLAGHATHFVVLFALAGLLFLQAARESKKPFTYALAGLCMGLAFLMKQPGFVFIIFGAQAVVWRAWKQHLRSKKLAVRLGVYVSAAALPYLATCAALYGVGVFKTFWFWTVSYASQYGTSTGFIQGWKYLRAIAPQLFFGAPVVWCFALMGLAIAIFQRRLGALLSFQVSLLLWSFVGVSAGLYYRDHYFILLLPAVSLLAGRAVKWCGEELAAHFSVRWLAAAPILVFIIGFGMALYAQRADFFELSPVAVIRHQYPGNPFPEAVQIGTYIREHAEPDAKIAVLGSEPEIYFYAERESATGYIYTYGLMEEQRYASQMQQEMMGEIERAKPEYLVKVTIPGSWLRKTNSDTTILLWADKYISESYRVVGIADVGIGTTYHWDDAAESYTPRSRYSVYVYKRKI